MKELTKKYEEIVDAEADFLDRIETCEAYLNAILAFTYQHSREHQKATVADIVMTVFSLSTKWRAELISIQIEKAHLSGEMGQRSKETFY
jgi:hypothetical protein